ncbi:hypothetical protein [Mucilaginibacter sp. L3T2-6]|uniref:hypothetical protein n=1 Tax=Mucilaginibacter sp. L3T2-6 TaxID=3062491 RepID=UPI002674E616|nr:hypothetical protein [Mucilaginibacter sp. L3T2-6]MDO3641284.1 hypothetical protein [Mucilaginibacter sp. L3T2-6]MDV6213956.1 hypothetical protein [Mucilaginibacter sp. L3T2-6]
MFHIFLALWLAFACPAQHHSGGNAGHTITATADSGTGGDNGHPPPPPPPPGS